jgi:hypothetical protein
MKKNMGMTDRVIRTLISVTILILYILHVINGTVVIVGLVVSGIFLLTSLIGFCPLYLPFGWNTKKRKQQHV